MHESERISVDTVNHISNLELFVDGDFIVEYSFYGSNITLGERSTSTLVNLEELSKNLEIIKNWINLLETFFVVNILPHSEYEIKMEKKNGKLKFKMHKENDEILDVEFSNSTKIFDFSPRDSVVLLYSDFKLWYATLRQLYTEAYKF